jgi:lysine 6-dehydrogenase
MTCSGDITEESGHWGINIGIDAVRFGAGTEMRALVLGAGMMGRAIAYDLARARGVDEVVLGDISLKAAKEAARWAGPGKIRPVRVDVADGKAVRRLMSGGFDVAAGAVSYRFNVALAREAIRAGVNFCDLGGNNTVVEKELALDAGAIAAGVTVVPDCGLAPGLVQPVAARALELLGGTADELRIRVGGLPLNPKPPLNYKLVFSPEGLVNEYWEPALALRNGKPVELESLTELEELEFPPPFGNLEAFVTSGGASTLPRTMLGKVRELDYKTIRYPGHCAMMKAMLWLGLGDTRPVKVGAARLAPRELLLKLLRKRLTDDDRDAVLMRVTARKGDRSVRFQMVDAGEPERGITAMMRTTAFPAAAVAWMLGSGRIARKGALPQESCLPAKEFLGEVAARCIRIEKRTEG